LTPKFPTLNESKHLQVFTEITAPLQSHDVMSVAKVGIYYTGCLKKERYYVALRRMLLKRLHLNEYKLSIVQGVERWIVCTPLIINFFVTLATQ
jgi:hypothetical protein